MDYARGEIILRISGYAEFAVDMMPDSNGNIVVVLQVFNEGCQLILNFKKNIDFEKSSCL